MNALSPNQRLANLLGAFALAVVDRIDTASRTEQLGLRSAAALVHVEHNPGCSQESLMKALGLSQPGTAHLVNRLEASGLLARESGKDARTRPMRLTREGGAVTRDVLDRRLAVVARLVEELPSSQRETLAEILPRLLEPLVESSVDVFRVCRLCDLSGCEAAGPCPVAEAAQRLGDSDQ